MSKFIDQLAAQFTGKRRSEHFPIKAKVQETDNYQMANPELLHEYVVTVEYKHRFYCRPEFLNEMMSNITRELKEHVYGEFRQMLIMLERDLYEEKFNEARWKIRDIINKVF